MKIKPTLIKYVTDSKTSFTYYIIGVDLSKSKLDVMLDRHLVFANNEDGCAKLCRMIQQLDKPAIVVPNVVPRRGSLKSFSSASA